MNKSNSSYFVITVSIGKILLEKWYKFFLNPVDWNTTNIAKDTLIIPTEETQKK